MYLRIADKFIKQGDYQAALDAVVKAREVDPQNRYAIAIEARIRNLMDESKRPAREKTASPPPPPQARKLQGAPPEPAELPSVEGQIQAIAMPIQPASAGDRSESKNLAILSKIATLLGSANDHLERHEYDRALDVVSRAALLDPSNGDIRAIEKRIRSAQEEAQRREEEEREARKRAERLRREQLMNAELDRLRREQEERRLYEEAERKKAQKVKALSVIKRAREFLSADQLQEAQCELAFVSVLDPDNPEVIALEREINGRREEQHRAELEAYRLQLEDQRRREQAVREEISRCVMEADAVAAEGRHAEALQIVTRAFMLDPVNSDLQACEQRILAAEQEHADSLKREREAQQEALKRKLEEEEDLRQAQERERLRREAERQEEDARAERQQQILQHLRKAHEHLALNDFTEAHAQVAAAFAIDPFDQDVLDLESRIAAEQTRASQRSPERSRPDPPLPEPETNDLPMEEAIEEVIARTLAEAKRLSTEGAFEEALEHIALAHSLDPENSLVTKFEDSVRKGMRETEARFRKETKHTSGIAAVVAPSRTASAHPGGSDAGQRREQETAETIDTLIHESLPADPHVAEADGLEKHWRRRAILAAIVLSTLLLLALSSLAPPLPVTQPTGRGWSSQTHRPPGTQEP